MAEILDSGFVRKTYDEYFTEFSEEWRRNIDENLVIDETTSEGSILASICDAFAKFEEILEAAIDGTDPDQAVGFQLVALAALTGTERKQPTQGTVIATCNLDGGRTYVAESLVAHEDGNTENRWYNREEIVTPSGAAADYPLTFDSEAKGSTAFVGSGDLTKIAGAVTGWNSVTNAADATPGQDLETIEDLRIRREQELATSGSASLAAIIADVSALDGVLDVIGEENTTNVTVDGIGPHGFRITLYDGTPSTVADNDLAQAIYEARAAGAQAFGTDSGTATSSNGESITEYFERATQKIVEINCDIETEAGVTSVAITDVKVAIIRAFAGITQAAATTIVEEGSIASSTIGKDVIYLKLAGSPFYVAGVEKVPTFQIRFTGDGWGTANLTVATDEIGTLDPDDITVTGDVS